MRSKIVILAIIIVVIGGTIEFKVYGKEQKVNDLVSKSDKLFQEEKYEEAKNIIKP